MLYILIGIVLYIAWENKFWGDRRIAYLYLTQLILNFLWSLLFFGLQSPALGLMDIVALDITVIATLILIYRKSKSTALLLIPYLGWILFASSLNLAILLLNL